MVGSIDPRCETVRGTHWPKKVAWLFGARVAETILASGPKSPHQQAGHMDASDPIKPSKKLLWHGGRPHMGPGFRGDDCEIARHRVETIDHDVAFCLVDPHGHVIAAVVKFLVEDFRVAMQPAD